jgi:hypothetical protein
MIPFTCEKLVSYYMELGAALRSNNLPRYISFYKKYYPVGSTFETPEIAAYWYRVARKNYGMED